MAHLTPGLSSRRKRGDLRHKAIAIVVAVGLHLALAAVIFIAAPAPPRMAALAEMADMQVSLVSSVVNPTLRPIAPDPATAPPSPPLPSKAAPSQQPAEDMPAPPLVTSSSSLSPVDITAQPIALTQPALSSATPFARPSSSTASETACDLTSALQHSLQADYQVQEELARIPRGSKSVANALMLWDGTWSQGYAPGVPPGSDPLQQAIISTIQAASPVCQATAMQGPRLLWISVAGSMTVLALGSGSWRWADLVDSAGLSP